MIKVFIERHAKDGKSLLPLFGKIRATAMQQPGYISGETLVSTENSSIITVISTWQSLKDWKTWEKSETRAKLEQLLEPHLVEKSKIRIYHYLSYKKIIGQD